MGLTALQERVVRTFFDLPESAGFVLAGGSALVVHRIVDRTTRDLDLFGSSRVVGITANALRDGLIADGLTCEEVHTNPAFVRLRVSDGDAATDVDVSYDPPWREALMTSLGPVRAPEELAIDKLLALFGRAQPRDYVDVFYLAKRFNIENMMQWAPEKDRGFSPYRLAEALGTMAGLPRQEFEVDEETFAEMQEFFAALRAELIRRTVDGED